MMRALILLHRVLGVLFCLFFAMWFASGIVMHFVPFPALTEAERFAGLAPIDLARVMHGPAEAVGASRIADATSVRLLGEAMDRSIWYRPAWPLRLCALPIFGWRGDVRGGACDCDGLRAAFANWLRRTRMLSH